jgi:hypothetical protein
VELEAAGKNYLMKRIIQIGLLLAVFILPAFSYLPKRNDLIDWSANRKLRWSDFKGKPYNMKAELAVTDYSISYTIHSFGDMLHISVRDCFSPQTSWTKDTTRKLLLIHEQGHFDLVEIYARKMRQALRTVNFKFDSVNVQFNKIYTKYYDQLNNERDAYDVVTEYSMNLIEQKKFGMKIDSILKTLDAYKDTVLDVKVARKLY